MKIFESKTLKEKAYVKKLKNGLTAVVVTKKNVRKKYAIIGTKFGSIDNEFIYPKTKEKIKIPDGVAHFLEHKMFEQENGRNSLDKLMALGIEANAYTTNDHTAYLIECVDNFYEGLDELMDYVQNPYFTEENVDKEKGIIAQEIKMYEDDPGWQVYINTMDALYKENPVKIDIAGTVETISKITPEILNKTYNTFYDLSNMVISICGDFEPEKMFDEIEKRIVEKPSENTNEKIKRIYPERENSKEINKKNINKKFDICTPLFMVGYKDDEVDKEEFYMQQITIGILLGVIVGKSSELFQELYNDGLTLSELNGDYEISEQYSHILISGQSENPKELIKRLKSKINEYKEKGINEEDFLRNKKKIYGNLIMEYNDVDEIARVFMINIMNGYNPFDIIECFDKINIDYANRILKEKFDEEKMGICILEKEN